MKPSKFKAKYYALFPIKRTVRYIYISSLCHNKTLFYNLHVINTCTRHCNAYNYTTYHPTKNTVSSIAIVINV